MTQFILPKQSHAFPRKQPAEGAQATEGKTVTVTLKPMRSGETVTLSDLSVDGSVHDVKTQYAQKTSQSVDKIRLLLNKKPAADLKTLRDLGVDGDVEFGVMIVGGAGGQTPGTEIADPVPATPAADRMEVDSQAPHPGSEKAQVEAEDASKGASAGLRTGTAVLGTAEFWTDLEDFLSQRLRDKAEAGKLAGVFKKAWESQ